MKIKICGLKHRQNIETVLSLCPDHIGLIFYPGSKRFAGDDAALASWLRPIKEIGKIGVFVNQKEAVILEKVTRYGLDYVQLHGTETAAFCSRIHTTVPIIKAFSMHAAFDFKALEAYVNTCSYFLFDTPSADYGGSGRSFDWTLLQQQEVPLPFLLSGGIGPGDVARIKQFRHPAFAGIDLNSRFEQSPGIKNYNLLNEFIDEIRN